MQQLLTYINEHTQILLERWYSLAQRLEMAAQQDKHTLLISLFQEHEIALSPLDGHPATLYGEHSTGAPNTLLLLSPAAPSLTRTHQWSALAARLLTLQLYRECFGDSLPVNVRWLIDTSNERASSSIHASFLRMKQHHQFLQVDGCLCDSATPSSFPALALGTKGMLRVSLEVDTRQTNAHGIYGSILPNAAWRLAWCLNSMKDAREDLLIDGFYDTLTPPEDDEIALLADTSMIEQTFQQRGHIPLLGLQGLQLRYAAQFLPTCTITAIQTEANSSTFEELQGEERLQEQASQAIPSWARAYLDFYLIPAQQPEDIFAKLQQHLHSSAFQDVQLNLLDSTPPVYTSLQNAFIQSVNSAVREVRTAGHYSTEALTLLPFATESTSFSTLSAPYDTFSMPIVFNQFGTLTNDTIADTRTRSTQLAHIAHFSVLLEEFRHAITTTRGTNLGLTGRREHRHSRARGKLPDHR